jgi:predicted transcriptional regulator
MSNTALAHKWILEVKLEQIKKWLEENERSQAWLARQSDISPENLNRIINGHVEPKFSTMEKIDEVIK